MDQVEEIKNKIDIVSLISEYLPLKKAGRNFKVLCPFHSEKTPSFIVSPERQIWHCFGCNRGGDVFGFLMQMENLEFIEALEILAKRAGVKLVKSYQISDQAKLKEKIYQINHLASEFYHYLLLNHPSGKKALDYLLNRGISKKSIETFYLGWAPNLWNSLIKFLNKKKSYLLSDLETAGLVIKAEGSYFDRFRGRLIFPIADHRGNIVGFSGRVLEQKENEAKYVNTPETPIFVKGSLLYGLDKTKEAIKKEDRAILVEGEFDLISSFQAGISNVVAIKGSALTENHVNLLKRFTQNLSFALDTDLAGDAAARRGIEIADQAGFSINVIQLPKGKDPDECIRSDPSLWFKAVKKAIPVFDYFINSALSRFDNQTAEGKKKIGDEVLPVLAKISNPIVQAHYLSLLAKILSVSEEVLVQTAQKIIKKEEKEEKTFSSVSPQMSKEQALEEMLLAFVLQSEEPKKLIEKVAQSFNFEDYLKTPVKKILELLKVFFEKEQEKGKISDFAKTLPEELIGIFDRAYLMDIQNILKDKIIFDRELDKIIKEIKKVVLKKKLLMLTEKIQKADEDELEELRRQFQETTLELKKCQ